MAFRLPLDQQETLGWWDSPPCFHRLHPQDFLLHTDASGMRNFQTVSQEKTLVLARVLHCCAERWGALSSHFKEPQWGWYCESLTHGTNGQRTQNLPTQDEEAAPWGGIKLLEAQRLLHPSRNIQNLPSPRSLPSGLMLGVPLFLHPLLQNPATTLPGKQRNPNKGLSLKAHQPLAQISPVTGSGPMLKEQKDTQMVAGILIHLLLRCKAPQWHPN